MKTVDDNGKLSMNFAEFIQFLHADNFQRKSLRDKEADELFKTIDTNNDGLISINELQTAMKSFGLKPKKCIARAMMLEADLNKDGFISKEEFRIAYDRWMVGAGRKSSLSANKSILVFSLGNNCHGQGGRVIIENEDYRSQSSCIPHRIEGVEKSVRQLVCGLDHTLILFNDGTVVAFGLGTDGQLGDGTFVTRWQPKVVEGDLKGENIVQIASSGDCCMAVSDKGDLFGWGNSEYKQLSVATNGIQGEVYSWGYGFLGHGPQNVAKSQPTLLPPPLFGCNQFDSDIVVRDIFAGIMNFGAVNNRGELFVWGKNDWASLGLNHDNEQFFPVKNVIGYDVTSVSFARFHTIVTVKER
uniref:EF-hand domain-containing protein n=1 Tax=Romanomermis culicivorax TaxID=13658 RepID=A0A915J103_ROMCU